ncbi:unnamed protein product [Victoria cruziana]
MSEQATTHVWMTVFSCLVNSCLRSPDFSSSIVHILMKKKPSSPTVMLSDGMIHVVRLSFITITENITPRKQLITTNAVAPAIAAPSPFRTSVPRTQVTPHPPFPALAHPPP